MKVELYWLKNSMAFHVLQVELDELWQCEKCGGERVIHDIPHYVTRIKDYCPEGCGVVWHSQIWR